MEPDRKKIKMTEPEPEDKTENSSSQLEVKTVHTELGCDGALLIVSRQGARAVLFGKVPGVLLCTTCGMLKASHLIAIQETHPIEREIVDFITIL